MRLLHTSDWHLGIHLKQATRHQELDSFLLWLEQQINEHQVEVLLHAGDVFHQALPSARAQRQFFDFLHRASRLPSLRHMVFVGGNHDSASRLEAPQKLLEEASVHVVGGFWNRPAEYGRYLFPLTDKEGKVRVVVAALPYIQEARLGLSAIGLSSEEHHSRYCEAFTQLYTDFLELAAQQYPDAAIVGMGHLTCGNLNELSEDDYMSEIHSIGALGSLPPTIFDSRYSYVALGHIHRCFRVGEPQVWYSGTPIPMRFNETNAPRRCLLVEMEGKEASVSQLRVPTWRQLLEWEGTEQELLSKLDLLAWPEELPPFLNIVLKVEQIQYGALTALNDRIAERFPEDSRPRIVEFRQERLSEDEEWQSGPELRLDQMSPLEVFGQLYRSRHGDEELPETFQQAFRTLLNNDHDEAENSDEEAV